MKNITLLILTMALFFNSGCRKSQCQPAMYKNAGAEYMEITKGSDYIILKNKCSYTIDVKSIGIWFPGPAFINKPFIITAWLSKKIYLKDFGNYNPAYVKPISRARADFTRWECESYTNNSTDQYYIEF